MRCAQSVPELMPSCPPPCFTPLSEKHHTGAQLLSANHCQCSVKCIAGLRCGLDITLGALIACNRWVAIIELGGGYLASDLEQFCKQARSTPACYLRLTYAVRQLEVAVQGGTISGLPSMSTCRVLGVGDALLGPLSDLVMRVGAQKISRAGPFTSDSA